MWAPKIEHQRAPRLWIAAEITCLPPGFFVFFFFVFFLFGSGAEARN